MNIGKATASSAICALLLAGPADAGEDLFRHINFGYGVDQGDTSLVGSLGRFNGYASNQGMALDFILLKGRLKKSWPVYAYLGAGIFVSRKDIFYTRLPLGVEYAFAKDWNVYAQLVPNARTARPDETDVVTGFGLRFQY